MQWRTPANLQSRGRRMTIKSTFPTPLCGPSTSVVSITNRAALAALLITLPFPVVMAQLGRIGVEHILYAGSNSAVSTYANCTDDWCWEPALWLNMVRREEAAALDSGPECHSPAYRSCAGRGLPPIHVDSRGVRTTADGAATRERGCSGWRDGCSVYLSDITLYSSRVPRRQPMALSPRRG